MKTEQIAAAIAIFAKDLQDSFTMEDRKDAVGFLANKIGSENANKIAEVFGLHGTYYKS